MRSFFLFRYVDRMLMALLPIYRAALQGALKRPWLVLGVAYSVLALVCFLLFPRLGSQFFPPAERNQLLVDIESPSSDSLTSTEGGGGSSGGSHQESRGSRQRGGVLPAAPPPDSTTTSNPRRRPTTSRRSSSTRATRTR